MAPPVNSVSDNLPTISRDKQLGLVFKLAAADLRHEWILTICFIMGIAAVLSPLLLLFGLKYGTISTLRFRLMEDPRNREIRPMISRSFNRDWLEELRRRPDVAFLIPTTRQISATVTAQIKSRGERVEADLVPTGNGDVLLLGNGSAIPQARECVLGSEVAGSLHARIGETVIITASRIKGGTDERVQLQVRVVGVLSPSGSGLKSIYVPLEVLENVERFKDGQAVPEFGWPGSIPRAYPLYNGVVLVMPKALAQEDEFALLSYSGFSRISQPGLGEIRTKTGVDVRTNGAAYLLEALYQPVSDEAVTNLGNRLRGKRAALFPWISPIRVELEEPSGRSIGPVALLSMVSAPRHGDVMAAEPLEETSDASTASLLKIMLPETLSVSSTNIVITVKTPESSLRFATTILSEHSQYDGVAFVPARLAGILKHAESRNIKFEPEEQEFVLSRRGYAGFRLYAKAINDVVELKQHLEAQGIPTSTEAQRIHDVTELDRQLALLFWMVAAIGVIGCIAALVANLYASVERKRRALAVLRLLGFSVRGLAWFPVFEGILLATGGTIVAFGFFAALSAAINALFVRHLQAGERICTLSWRHLIAIISGSLLVAVGASTLAAWRARRIEFAESLRED